MPFGKKTQRWQSLSFFIIREEYLCAQVLVDWIKVQIHNYVSTPANTKIPTKNRSYYHFFHIKGKIMNNRHLLFEKSKQVFERVQCGF